MSPSCVWTLEVGKRIISFNTTLLQARGVSTSVGAITASQRDCVILGADFLGFMDLDIRKAEVKLSGDGGRGILQSHHLEKTRATFTSTKWSPQGPC